MVLMERGNEAVYLKHLLCARHREDSWQLGKEWLLVILLGLAQSSMRFSVLDIGKDILRDKGQLHNCMIPYTVI